MRDFYEIYFLSKEKQEELQEGISLHKAFLAIAKKRATIFKKEEAMQICERILHDKAMESICEKSCIGSFLYVKMNEFPLHIQYRGNGTLLKITSEHKVSDGKVGKIA